MATYTNSSIRETCHSVGGAMYLMVCQIGVLTCYTFTVVWFVSRRVNFTIGIGVAAYKNRMEVQHVSGEIYFMTSWTTM